MSTAPNAAVPGAQSFWTVPRFSALTVAVSRRQLFTAISYDHAVNTYTIRVPQLVITGSARYY